MENLRTASGYSEFSSEEVLGKHLEFFSNLLCQYEETAKKIQTSMRNGDMPSSKTIGLKNVNKRLRLIFGDNYGCAVSATDDIFTVEMKIPVIENL